MNPTQAIICLLVMSVSMLMVSAQEEAAVVTPSEAPILEGLGKPIPQAYLSDRYSGTWNKNPFLIGVVVPECPGVNPFADWVLTGLTIPSSGNATAFIKNRQTNDFKKLSTTPNEKEPDGFILKKANPNRDRRQATVEVQKGAETGTLHFDDTPNAAPSASDLRPRVLQQPKNNRGNRSAPQAGINPRPGIPQPSSENNKISGLTIAEAT